MTYIIRQGNPCGGAAGCFGKPSREPQTAANLVCPLCAHESGRATRLTARVAMSRYIECEVCGRFSAVFTEDGAALVPGVVAHALLTGLAHGLPAARHAIILDGLAEDGVEPAADGDYSDLVAALKGDGQLLTLTQVGPAASRASNRRPVVRVALSDAARRLEGLSRAANTADDESGVGAPEALARLLQSV